MTLDVDVVAIGGGLTESADVVSSVLGALADRERAAPMLGVLGLSKRVRVVPADEPLGSLGAVLALRSSEAT